MGPVSFEAEETTAIVTINRPEVRNAVSPEVSLELANSFRRFDRDQSLRVAILTGAGGCFCAGADLKVVATGQGNRVTEEGDGPLGCSRMLLSKPVIAAVEGYAVPGGIELPCGAICESPHGTRFSACSAGAGEFLSLTVGRSGCRGSSE